MEAYILSNLHGPLIILVKTFFGRRSLQTEQVGILCQLLGTFLIVMDPLGARVDNHQHSLSILIGLVLSSIFGTVYFLLNERRTIELRICTLVFYQSVQMFLISSVAAVIATKGQAQIISNDAVSGCFGFLASDYFVLMILLQGVLSGVCGGFGLYCC